MLSASCLVAFVSAVSLGQGTVSIEAILTPPVVPFHRVSKYAVVVEAPSGLDLRLPDMTKAFGELMVYGMSEYRTEPLPGGRVRITETYTLDPVEVKDYAIDPAKVTWGEDESVSTPMLTFRVRDLTDEERVAAEIFDGAIPHMRESPSGGLPGGWRTWAIASVMIAVLFAILFYFLRDRAPMQDIAIRKEPWEIAFERLRTLQERRLPQAGRHQTYYVDLSAILRYYIEGRFLLHAPERTTPEFLVETTGQGLFSQGQEEFLSEFLRHCDSVKFAQYEPAMDEMNQSFSRVEHFVEQTVPPQADAEEAA